MTFEVLVSFIVASALLCLSPGPIVITIIAQVVANGRDSIRPLAAGIMLGDLTAMTVSLAGMGAILATSAELFNIMKWLGAAYLIYLGLTGILKKPQPVGETKISSRNVFKQCFLIAALNPKGILFYTAFFPLFINPEGSVLQQSLILGTVFQIVALSSLTFYCMSAHLLRDKMNSPRAVNVFNKVGGSMMVSAGVATAMIEK